MSLSYNLKMSLCFSVVFFLNVSSSAQPSTRLLVRADDMGKNYGRTMGIIKAYQDGIITSSSLMVTSAFFMESVQLCKENPKLAIGLHLTISDGTQRPVLSPELVPSLVDSKGFFQNMDRNSLDLTLNREEVEKEIRAQIGKARASGLHFVYLDWHRGIPRDVEDLIRKIGKEQKLVYGQDREGSIYGYKYLKMAPESWPNQILPDGQRANYAAPAFTDQEEQIFYDALKELKPGNWWTFVHPGMAEPERKSVTKLMCSPTTRQILNTYSIILISYYDLWEEEFGHND